MIGTMERMAGAKLEEQQAILNLLAITKPSADTDVVDEVKRRAEVFRERWETTPQRRPFLTPTCAATKSVYLDVASGWL